MKRVLILNGDSFVGVQTAKAFYHSKEYEISVTLTDRDDDTVERVRYTPPENKNRDHLMNPSVVVRRDPISIKEALVEEDDTVRIPAALQPYITAVIPSHNTNPEEFCRQLLTQDVVVAVLEDDSYEAECAIKVLMGSHYEVEKTFVLVSTVMTWAYTLPAERSRARAAKRAELEKEREAFLEEREEDEEIPPHLTEESIEKQFAEELDDAEAEELVPMRVFTESDYTTRVPHPRYQQWKMIEHLTKHANSESLHTYVLFSGLPYGRGEGELQPLFKAALGQSVLQQYGNGKNHIPMIHVDDLAAIIYKVGNAYEPLEERYLFAVDRANLTQNQLLECLRRRMGGVVRPAEPTPSLKAHYPSWEPLYVENGHPVTRHSDNVNRQGLLPRGLDLVNVKESSLTPPPPLTAIEQAYRNTATNLFPFLVSDIMADPGAVLQLHAEENWVAMDGFVDRIDQVMQQFYEARHLAPFRAMVSGPPLSGKELVAEQLANTYRVPHLTLPHIVKAYETHAEALRTELHDLLTRRLTRRRQRAHARRRRLMEATAAESKLQKEMEKAEKNKQRGTEGDEEEEEEEEEEREEGGEMDGDAVSLDVSEVFDEDMHAKTVSEVVNEQYLLGDLDGGEEEEEIDEEIEEEDGDEVLLEEEEDEEGVSTVTKGQRYARSLILEIDVKERIRIAELRAEYKLAKKALSNRFVDGKLPRMKDESEESDEEAPAAPVDASKKGKNKKAAYDGEGSDEEEEGEEREEEEEVREDSDEGDEEDEGTFPVMSSSKTTVSAAPEDYFDEALAFFTRWRLRQPDCVARGYVLDSFPTTVRQALLVFHADDESEAELRPKRSLPPTDPEQVCPPIDVQFPFIAWENMSNEERTAFEEQCHSGRLPLVTFGTDGGEEGAEVLAAVEEGLFPEYVLFLSDSDKVLQTRAGILLSQFKEAAEAQKVSRETSSGGGVRVRPAGSARGPGGGLVYRKDFFSSPTSANPGGAIVQSDSACLEAPAPKHSIPSVLVNFYEQLQRYKNHHRLHAAPSESVLVWLQSVMTTAVRGFSSPLPAVLYDNPDLADSEEDEAPVEAEGEGEEVASGRSAKVMVRNAPTRDCAVVRDEVLRAEAAYERQLAASRKFAYELPRWSGVCRPFCYALDAANLAGALFYSDVIVASKQAGAAEKREPFVVLQDVDWEEKKASARNKELGLQFMVLDMLYSSGTLPLPPWYGPRLTNDLSNPFSSAHRKKDASPEAQDEKKLLQRLAEAEKRYQTEAKEEEKRILSDERRLLRVTQVKEKSHDFRFVKDLPMETYLMEYVIPSVTPLLADVTRLRRGDPVTVMADLLFNHQRQKNL